MRETARKIIEDAAVTAGLAATNVVDKSKKPPIILPKKRVEFETLGETTIRDGKPFAKLPVVDGNGDVVTPKTQVIYRKRMYKVALKVRLVIHSDEEVWLEGFKNDFLIQLPSKTADNGNNCVTVKVETATRGGFVTGIADPLPKKSVVMYMVVNGGIYKDELVDYILDINLKDGLTIN